MPDKKASLTIIENKILEIIPLLMGIHTGIRKRRQATGIPKIPAYQLKAIAAFQSEKAPTVGELTKNAFVNKSSMSEMIKRLEKAGLVRRMRNPDNQREVQVSLTPRGLALRRQITETRSKELQKTFSVLDMHQRAALTEALESATALIQEALKSRK